MCRVGAAIVDHRPKTHVKRHFRAVFDNSQPQCVPPHTRDKTTVEAVGSTWWKCAEKGEDRFIGREGNGYCSLRCSRIHASWILTEGSKNHREILCNTSKPFSRKTANRTSEPGGQKILFHQVNALAYTSAVLMTRVHELGFTLFP